ncbi:hypothetical protein Q8F55_008381 [Vanrija albida]|uniref:Fe2OG dioxygenase domain-containing protein n=1 Tax=Vanrija albida TaxID=181172 RepID=A0ABR3PW66_9TREE
MPAPVHDDLLHFTPVAPSTMDLPYADLAVVDMSTWHDGPDAQAAISAKIAHAMHTDGFFTLVGHGISEEEIARQVDIGYTVLQRTPLEEKKRLRAQMQELGTYKGFKLRNYYEFGKGVTDKIEQFNWYRDMASQEFPSTILPYFDEVKGFTETVHKKVLFELLRAFAHALELPSETFVDTHKFDVHDESWMRYMAFYDEHTKEEEDKVKGVWLKGHQDFGSLTFVFSQPMASLQVRDDAGTWRYVRHTPGGIIVNCGVFMEWYTGGYFKAANHRVAAPPADQRGHTRCGVFYFAVPNDEEKPNTLLAESAVLQRAGVRRVFESDDHALTSKVYSQARISRVGKSETYMRPWGDGEVVVEMIAGVEVPWYG